MKVLVLLLLATAAFAADTRTKPRTVPEPVLPAAEPNSANPITAAAATPESTANTIMEEQPAKKFSSAESSLETRQQSPQAQQPAFFAVPQQQFYQPFNQPYALLYRSGEAAAAATTAPQQTLIIPQPEPTAEQNAAAVRQLLEGHLGGSFLGLGGNVGASALGGPGGLLDAHAHLGFNRPFARPYNQFAAHNVYPHSYNQFATSNVYPQTYTTTYYPPTYTNYGRNAPYADTYTPAPGAAFAPAFPAPRAAFYAPPYNNPAAYNFYYPDNANDVAARMAQPSPAANAFYRPYYNSFIGVK